MYLAHLFDRRRTCECGCDVCPLTVATVWFPSPLQYSSWWKANLDEKYVGMNVGMNMHAHTYTYVYIVILFLCCYQHLMHENQG